MFICLPKFKITIDSLTWCPIAGIILLNGKVDLLLLCCLITTKAFEDIKSEMLLVNFQYFSTGLDDWAHCGRAFLHLLLSCKK